MLRGEKVILRAIEREDLKRLWELQHNVDLLVWSQEDWMPTSLAVYEHEFEKGLDRESSSFVIEADGQVIGNIGLYDQDRRSGVTSFGMGIFDANYVGKGYGRDALRVMLDWTFHIQNYRRVWLSVLGNNERAIGAYRAVGFVEEARLRKHEVFNGEYVDLLKMGILRSEWEQRAR